MVTLTIKNIPESLVKRLKQQAAAHRQSVRLEVISYLEQMTDSAPGDSSTLLVRARALRGIPKRVRETDRLLNSLKGGPRSMSKANVRERQKVGEFKR